MKLAEARTLFKGGYVTDARIIRAESNDKGWILEMTIDENTNFDNRIYTERGEVRIFRSIDAAASAAESIGFQTASIILK